MNPFYHMMSSRPLKNFNSRHKKNVNLFYVKVTTKYRRKRNIHLRFPNTQRAHKVNVHLPFSECLSRTYSPQCSTLELGTWDDAQQAYLH